MDIYFFFNHCFFFFLFHFLSFSSHCVNLHKSNLAVIDSLLLGERGGKKAFDVNTEYSIKSCDSAGTCDERKHLRSECKCIFFAAASLLMELSESGDEKRKSCLLHRQLGSMERK